MKYKLLITSLLLTIPCTAFASDITMDVGGMHLSVDSSAEGDDVKMIMDDGTSLSVSGEEVEINSDNSSIYIDSNDDHEHDEDDDDDDDYDHETDDDDDDDDDMDMKDLD